MTFVRIFTYVTDSVNPDLGIPIDQVQVEKVEMIFNPNYVVYIEGKGAGSGCEISMVNGECFFVDVSPQQVAELIKKAKQNEFYSAAN